MTAAEDRYTKTFPISWEQLHRDSKALAWRLVDLEEWQGIVAITRGGMVPASIIARELEIRHVDTVCVSSYDVRAQGEITVLAEGIPPGTDVYQPVPSRANITDPEAVLSRKVNFADFAVLADSWLLEQLWP